MAKATFDPWDAATTVDAWGGATTMEPWEEPEDTALGFHEGPIPVHDLKPEYAPDVLMAEQKAREQADLASGALKRSPPPDLTALERSAIGRPLLRTADATLGTAFRQYAQLARAAGMKGETTELLASSAREGIPPPESMAEAIAGGIGSIGGTFAGMYLNPLGIPMGAAKIGGTVMARLTASAPKWLNGLMKYAGGVAGFGVGYEGPEKLGGTGAESGQPKRTWIETAGSIAKSPVTFPVDAVRNMAAAYTEITTADTPEKLQSGIERLEGAAMLAGMAYHQARGMSKARANKVTEQQVIETIKKAVQVPEEPKPEAPAKEVLLTPEGAKQFAADNRYEASQIVSAPQATRKVFKELLPGSERWSKDERARLQALLSRAMEPPVEVPNAGEVRSDSGRVPEEGPQPGGVEDAGRENLQRAAEAGPEAGGAALGQAPPPEVQGVQGEVAPTTTPKSTGRKGIGAAEKAVMDLHEKYRDMIRGTLPGETGGELETGATFVESEQGRKAYAELVQRLEGRLTPQEIGRRVKLRKESGVSTEDVTYEKYGQDYDRLADAIVAAANDTKAGRLRQTLDFVEKNPKAFTPDEVEVVRKYLAIREGVPYEPPATTPLKPPETGLFGQPIFEPLTGKQQGLEFGQSLEGKTPTKSGWVNQEGRLEPTRDLEAEVRIEAENKAEGQMMLGDQKPPEGDLAGEENLPPYEGPEPGGSTPFMRKGVLSSVRAPMDRDLAGKPNVEPISVDEVAAGIQRVMDLPIRKGRLAPQADSEYSELTQQMRMSGITPTPIDLMLHETGHHLYTREKILDGAPLSVMTELQGLDYDPKALREKEGLAEYMRWWFSGEDPAKLRAEGPLFTDYLDRWMKKNPAVAERMQQTKDLVTRYRLQGSDATVAAQVSDTKKPLPPPGETWYDRAKAWTADFIHQQYRYFKFSGEAVDRFTKEYRKAGGKAPIGEDPAALLMAFSKAGPGYAMEAMRDGPFYISGGRFKEKAAPGGYPWVFEKIDPKAMKDWVLWAYSEHSKLSWDLGKNPGLPRDVAEKYALEHRTPEFEETLRRFTEFNNGLVNVLVDSGVLTKEEAKAAFDVYDNYMPLYRVVSKSRIGGFIGGEKYVNLGKEFRRRVGSNAQVYNPIYATVEKAIRIYQRAMRQEVINAMDRAVLEIPMLGRKWGLVRPHMQRTPFTFDEVRGQLLKAGADKDVLDEVRDSIDPETLLFLYRPDYQPSPKELIVRVTREGKPSLRQVDPDLYRAMTGMDAYDFGRYRKILYPILATARNIRLGATGLSTLFAGKNVVWDWGSYLMQTRHSLLNPRTVILPGEMMGRYIASAIGEFAGKSPDVMVRLWKEMQGPLGTKLGLDSRRIRKGVEEVMQSALERKAYHIVEHPIEALRDVVNISEAAARLAEFQRTLESHGWDRARIKREGNPPRNVLVDAINSAHDVTLNYKRMGVIGEPLNQLIPFFNAPLEGFDKMVRTWKTQPEKAFVRSAALALATALIWHRQHNTDEYKEREAWLKYGFWTITDERGNPWVRIPRPREWSWTISVGVEALLNRMYDKDPQAVDEWFTEAGKQLGPNFGVAGLTQLAEVLMPGTEGKGYSFFRQGPIVPEGLAQQLPEKQFGPDTSWLMRRMGETLGWSPMKMEHFVNGVTGGQYGRISRDIEHLKTGKLETADIPFVGGFVIRKDYVRSINDFYETKGRVAMNYASQRGTPGGKVDPEVRDAALLFDQYADVMGEMRKSIREVRDPKLRAPTERYITGLARFATGKPELDRYPNPLRAAPSELPEGVREPILKFVRAQRKLLQSGSRPERNWGESLQDFKDRQEEWSSRRRRAKTVTQGATR